MPGRSYVRPRGGLSPEARALRDADNRAEENEEMPAPSKKEKKSIDKALSLLRNNYMVFIAADEDRSGSFGYSEFRGMLPLSLQNKKGDREIRSWFDAMDKDKDGKISLAEYFLFSVTSSCMIADCSIAALFSEHDEDGTCELDEKEFETAVTTMGFGKIAATLFSKFDRDHSGTITVGELFNTSARHRPFSQSLGTVP